MCQKSCLHSLQADALKNVSEGALKQKKELSQSTTNSEYYRYLMYKSAVVAGIAFSPFFFPFTKGITIMSGCKFSNCVLAAHIPIKPKSEAGGLGLAVTGFAF